MRHVCLLLFVSCLACGGKSKEASAPEAAPEIDAGVVDAAPPPLTPEEMHAENERAQKRDARDQFRLAVKAIAVHHGAQIALTDEIVRERCGGLTGPGCGATTMAMEAAKVIAPVVAQRYSRELEEVLGLLREAVTIHSIWHDAFGYAYSSAKVGPGYAYAGCALSPCEPDNPLSGQLDGILFQLSRLLGGSGSPACGPGCPFKIPEAQP